MTDLTQARRAAEAANRAKDEFLAMLGHELRNPLAPIVLALELMRARKVPGADRERAIIERQVKHVVGLVDDLLDVSRITRGQVQLKRERVDIVDVVAKAVEMTEAMVSAKRQRIQVDVPAGLVVSGDAARLVQVMINLLTNASKYTDAEGRIDIRAGIDGEQIEIVVRDTGRGISAETLPLVFDLFTQERQEIDRSEGGLGLGLAIVRSLVQAHGGSVHAASAGKGQGAEFRIRLAPENMLAPPARQPDTVVVSPSGSFRLRVLVVDDNRDAADLLAEFVSSLGHLIEVAGDGPTALQRVEAFRPEVVLLDLGLPGMNGFELAQRIRTLPDRPDIKLVAITGYGRAIDRQRSHEAGFDHHMVKPVSPDALADWLRAEAARRGP